jgi:molybdopterin/thiamine biosynthesis adenylyltransferase
MNAVQQYLWSKAVDDLVPWSAQAEAARQFGFTYGQVEGLILDEGLLPTRYQRNRSTVSIDEQLQLFNSRVAVIGCGGLGGYIIEELARLGVGRIVAIDPDIFEEHNLNRQLLSSPASLGKAKVDVAAARIAEINPAVNLVALQETFTRANGQQLLEGAMVAVDALDSISFRLELAETCTEMEMPMVYGAIGGWYGHVATQLPGDTTIQRTYRNWVEGKGIEKQLGNPAFTPAVVASLQVAEVCKILLGKGELLRHRKLSIDLLEMEIFEVSYEAPAKLVRAA